MKDNTLRDSNTRVKDMVNELETITYYKHHYVRKTGLKKAIKALLAEEVRKAILAGWRQAGEGYNNEEDYNNEYWSGKITLDEIEKQVIEDALAELEKEGK